MQTGVILAVNEGMLHNKISSKANEARECAGVGSLIFFLKVGAPVDFLRCTRPKEVCKSPQRAQLWMLTLHKLKLCLVCLVCHWEKLCIIISAGSLPSFTTFIVSVQLTLRGSLNSGFGKGQPIQVCVGVCRGIQQSQSWRCSASTLLCCCSSAVDLKPLNGITPHFKT